MIEVYLAHENAPPPRTLRQETALGTLVVLGGGVVSYARGARVVPPHDGVATPFDKIPEVDYLPFLAKVLNSWS